MYKLQILKLLKEKMSRKITIDMYNYRQCQLFWDKMEKEGYVNVYP